MTCHEDVTLVRQIEAMGMRISWSAMPTVRTSSRRVARVQGGFSDFLKSLESVVPMGLHAAASALATAAPIAIVDDAMPRSPEAGLVQTVGLALGLNASTSAPGLTAPSGV